ncbi:nucleotide-binding protein [Novacetimonas cocois]|uniref:nucleotide-binding protein n=1 Tax=Novacetimonas cocois TaxID=1747507 RepID=UPI001401D88E|nr:nucleotide-binding protein [Novacetimonas cocois]
MGINVFFSWQSDIPTQYGKSFIEEALKQAAKEISTDLIVEEAHRTDVVIDSDTKGRGGTIPIVQTILEKISESDIFVADLTFVGESCSKNEREGPRKTPNPNVLIEYGYALAKLSDARIICVMNGNYGKPTEYDLPFDLRHLRHPIQFNIGEDNCGKAIENRKIKKNDEKINLTKTLKNALSLIISEQNLYIPYDTQPEEFVEKWHIGRPGGLLLGPFDTIAEMYPATGARDTLLPARWSNGLWAWTFLRPVYSQKKCDVEIFERAFNVTKPLPIFGQTNLSYCDSPYGKGLTIRAGDHADHVEITSIVLCDREGEIWSRDTATVDMLRRQSSRLLYLNLEGLRDGLASQLDFLKSLGISFPLKWEISIGGTKGWILPDYRSSPSLQNKTCPYDSLEYTTEITELDNAEDIISRFMNEIYDRHNMTQRANWFS